MIACANADYDRPRIHFAATDAHFAVIGLLIDTNDTAFDSRRAVLAKRNGMFTFAARPNAHAAREFAALGREFARASHWISDLE